MQCATKCGFSLQKFSVILKMKGGKCVAYRRWLSEVIAELVGCMIKIKRYTRAGICVSEIRRFLHNESDLKRLERTANLGTMVQLLQAKVPIMTTRLLPQKIVSKNVMLRILPEKFPNLPVFKGIMCCNVTLKAIQKGLTMFYLNPKSQIHITNIIIEEPMKSFSSDELINLSIDDNLIEQEAPTQVQNLSQYTSKIKIKWRTCYTGCEHLKDTNSNEAKYGVFRIDNFNWGKLLKSSNPIQTLAVLEAKKTLEGISNTIKSFENELKSSGANGNQAYHDVGRVLTGMFIFELNANNDKIIVLTVDNMEILESKDFNFNNNNNTLSPI